MGFLVAPIPQKGTISSPASALTTALFRCRLFEVSISGDVKIYIINGKQLQRRHRISLRHICNERYFLCLMVCLFFINNPQLGTSTCNARTRLPLCLCLLSVFNFYSALPIVFILTGFLKKGKNICLRSKKPKHRKMIFV